MGDPWGIGGFTGGGKPNIKQIVKKNRSKNIKNRRIRKKNWKNQIFLLKMV